MNALNALHNRVSSIRLREPGPSKEALDNIKKAALRAADHRHLRPWKFLVIEGEGRKKLGELFVAAQQQKTKDSSEIVNRILAKKSMRAPTIIIMIACIKSHPKVPEIEQLISTGAAAQNMLNAAYAQEIGAIWRTGDIAYNDKFAASLGLNKNEKIIGFLYLGTNSDDREPNPPQLDISQYFKSWPL